MGSFLWVGVVLCVCVSVCLQSGMAEWTFVPVLKDEAVSSVMVIRPSAAVTQGRRYGGQVWLSDHDCHVRGRACSLDWCSVSDSFLSVSCVMTQMSIASSRHVSCSKKRNAGKPHTTTEHNHRKGSKWLIHKIKKIGNILAFSWILIDANVGFSS